ncbi:unnamed protein product [Brassica oleracea]
MSPLSLTAAADCSAMPDPYLGDLMLDLSIRRTCYLRTGVTCGRKHKRVTRLDLGGFQLGGVISPFIGNLSFLTSVELFWWNHPSRAG